eukprot:UC1_evm1s1589
MPLPSVTSLKRIGCYELGRKLGEGAFAVVREARHLPTNEMVAVKLIDKTKITDDYVQDNLYREADVLSRLAHPHIIRLLDNIETDRYLCLVMEKGERSVLTALLDGGVLSEDAARKFTLQLVSAVDHWQRRDIVHRDLKVENMLLDRAGNVKVIDFGLCNSMAGKDALETWCGSLAYSAPELLHKKPYGKAVDVWGVGVCLYVMLTKRLPFPCESLTQLHALMLERDFKLPEHLSPPLKDLLDRCFEVKPRNRITLEEIINHDWFKVTLVGGQRKPQDYLGVDSPDVAIDGALLTQMERMGHSREAALAEVRSRAVSSSAASYTLLNAKKQRWTRLKSRQRAEAAAAAAAAAAANSVSASSGRGGGGGSGLRRSASFSARSSAATAARRAAAGRSGLSRPVSRGLGSDLSAHREGGSGSSSSVSRMTGRLHSARLDSSAGGSSSSSGARRRSTGGSSSNSTNNGGGGGRQRRGSLSSSPGGDGGSSNNLLGSSPSRHASISGGSVSPTKPRYARPSSRSGGNSTGRSHGVTKSRSHSVLQKGGGGGGASRPAPVPVFGVSTPLAPISTHSFPAGLEFLEASNPYLGCLSALAKALRSEKHPLDDPESRLALDRLAYRALLVAPGRDLLESLREYNWDPNSGFGADIEDTYALADAMDEARFVYKRLYAPD